MTDCERYETLLSWITGPGADPQASKEDRELSDTDIAFLVEHRNRCTNDEHGDPNWIEELEKLGESLTGRFRSAMDDLAQQERGILTDDSPHYWTLEVIKSTGAEGVRGLPDLIGRTFVFTYNLDREDDVPEQCGQIAGTITGISVGTIPEGDSRSLKFIHLNLSETRFRFHTDEGKGFARTVFLGLSIVEGATRVPNAAALWHLVFLPWELVGGYKSISGILRILPH